MTTLGFDIIGRTISTPREVMYGDTMVKTILTWQPERCYSTCTLYQ